MFQVSASEAASGTGTAMNWNSLLRFDSDGAKANQEASLEFVTEVGNDSERK
jgi:hypothetical protein